MTTEENKNITLDDGDCCLILRSDGKVETLIPNLDDEAPVPDTIMLITACAAAMQHPPLVDSMMGHLHTLLDMPLEEISSQLEKTS